VPPSNTNTTGSRILKRFSLEPAQKLGPGPFHTQSSQPLLGAIADSAPGRWGLALMRRAERRRAESERQTPRTLREIDYLLMVDDEARMGALRLGMTYDYDSGDQITGYDGVAGDLPNAGSW
jgi:serine/threonine-protein kinase HipA